MGTEHGKGVFSITELVGWYCMLSLKNNIQNRVAFLVPLFIFAGYFKSEEFAFARWYLDLTFWLLIFIFIVQLSKANWKRIHIRSYNPVFLIILPIAFMILASILFGDLVPNAYIKIRDFIVILIPTVIVSFWVVKSEADWRYLGNGVLALGLYTSFYIYFNSIYETWGSISYLFSGTLTSLGGLISIQRLFAEVRRKWFYILTFCICSIGVTISYARGQQIIYVLVVLIVFAGHFFFRSKMPKKVIMILCLFCLLGTISVTYMYKLNRGQDVFSRFKSQDFGETWEIRGALLKEAWELFKQNPIIFAGIGRYSLEGEGYSYFYPHNIPLEFAAEFGIWGLLFYCYLFSCVFCGYWRFRHTRVIREHSVLYLFILLTSLKQDYIYNSKAFWVWAALGMGLLSWRKVRNKCMIKGKIES